MFATRVMARIPRCAQKSKNCRKKMSFLLAETLMLGIS